MLVDVVLVVVLVDVINDVGFVVVVVLVDFVVVVVDFFVVVVDFFVVVVMLG